MPLSRTRQTTLVSCRFQLHGDGPALRGKFYGVGQEVHPHLPQQILAAGEGGFGQGDLYPNGLCGPLGLQQQNDILYLPV